MAGYGHISGFWVIEWEGRYRVGKANKEEIRQSGILRSLQTYMRQLRLGDLMVARGLISQSDLTVALATQSETRKPLGQILIAQDMVSRHDLRMALIRQGTLRMLAAFLLCALSLTSFGTKKARADHINDVPARVAITASAQFNAVAAYPPLFGSSEKRSANLKPFTKWTGMFERFERELDRASAQKAITEWQNSIRRFEGLSLRSMADKVNDFVNETRYIVDSKNWGRSDYWATPVEFMQRGGDCEDFAIAKYTALRALGVPEERLRVAIVHDLQKNIPHAVLIVYTDDGSVALDNQTDYLIDGERLERYKPIFSINRQAWWLHTSGGGKTLVASRE